MAKVVMLLSNAFRPDPRVYKEAKALVENGHDLEIIAWDRDGKHPKKEVMEGFKITRYFRHAKPNDFLSVASNISFFHYFAFRQLVKRNPDIIHCHDFDTITPGLWAAKLTGTKLIYDAHELYPEMVSDIAPKSVVSLLKRIDGYAAHRISAIICVSSALAEYFRESNAKNIVVVMNCLELNTMYKEKGQMLRKGLDPDRKKLVVLYLGGLEPKRMVDRLLDISRDIGEDYLLVLGGFGTLENEVRSRESKTMKFIGHVGFEEAQAYNNAADVIIGLYDPGNMNNRIGAPNKLFEAMAAGKPIIVAKGTFMSEVVEREKCGMSVTYGSTEELLGALQKLREDEELRTSLGANGLKAAGKKYNWSVMKQRLLKLYSDLTGK
jgi:glycosyltransferase involved in cell wall biosynthesis